MLTFRHKDKPFVEKGWFVWVFTSLQIPINYPGWFFFQHKPILPPPKSFLLLVSDIYLVSFLELIKIFWEWAAQKLMQLFRCSCTFNQTDTIALINNLPPSTTMNNPAVVYYQVKTASKQTSWITHRTQVVWMWLQCIYSGTFVFNVPIYYTCLFWTAGQTGPSTCDYVTFWWLTCQKL